MNDVDVVLIHPRSVNYTAPAGTQIEQRWVFDDPNVTKDYEVTITGNLTTAPDWLPIQPVVKKFMPIMDDVELSHTKDDGVINVTVNGRPGISSIYVTSNAGIVPKSKVPLDSTGHGTFKILTTGLDTGDEVIVKVGYKNISNVNSVSVTL